MEHVVDDWRRSLRRVRRPVALTLTSVMLLASSASGQPWGSRAESPDPGAVGAEASRPATAENAPAPPSPRANDLESDVAALKADNAAVREQLRRMEEQQKALLELVDRLQRRLDGTDGGPEAAAATAPGTTPAGEA